jgi:hypothetical protein
MQDKTILKQSIIDDGIGKSIKTVILRRLRQRIGLDWRVGLTRFFGCSSLRMTIWGRSGLKRFFPDSLGLRSSGSCRTHIITFYKTINYSYFVFSAFVVRIYELNGLNVC